MFKKFRKSTLAILAAGILLPLILALAFVFAPEQITAAAAEIKTETQTRAATPATLTDTLYWGVTEAKKLIISADENDSEIAAVTDSASKGSFSEIWQYGASWQKLEPTTAVIKGGVAPASTANWFYDCEKLTSIDLSGLNTSNVNNMHNMFHNCLVLNSLDVSGFDTKNVTDMSGMFGGCAQLTSLDISGFDTKNVNNMNSMFAYCEELTSLDVSKLKTANVTDMSWMFYRSRKLDSLDLSTFDVSQVTHMDHMFYNCNGLITLNMSGFNKAIITTIDHMFQDCSSLTSLNLSGLNASNVTDITYMFYGCNKLTDLDMSNIDFSSLTNMHRMFEFNAELKTIDMSGMKIPLVTDMSEMFYNCGSLQTVDLSGVNASKANVTTDIFYSCYSLETVNMSDADFSSMTSTSGMFRNFSSLKTVDLSGMKVPSVKNMSYMFYGCSGLTSLTLTGLDTSSVTSMSSMFEGCSGLTTVDLTNWDISSVTSMYNMFYGCSGLTSLDMSGKQAPKVTSMSEMFYNCRSLTTLDMSGLKAPLVTDISNIFNGCRSMETLDMSDIDFSSLTRMTSMFNGGMRGLTTLDLSGLKAPLVTDMSGMFYTCSSLTSLNLSGLDTSSVTNMSFMFRDCSSLTSFNIKSFDLGQVTNMSNMFYGCSGLTSLDMSDMQAPLATDISNIFAGCSSLETLNMSGVNLSSAANIGTGVFAYRSSLKEVDLSNADFSSVTDMSYIFRNCSALTTIDLSGIKAPLVTDMSWMFYNCSSLTSLNMSEMNASKATNTSNIFNGCSSLEKLNMSGIDFSSMTETGDVFKLKSLKELDISNASFSSMTDMSRMFLNCSGLTTLNVTGMNAPSVTNMSYMFYGLSGLTTLDLTGLDTSQVTNMSYMFSGCSGLTTLDLSGLNTSSVTNMSSMFNGCSGLTTLDLTGMNTAQVTNMSSMFNICRGLTTLDMSGLNVSQVADMNRMFWGCSALKTLNMSGLNASQVTNMGSMFAGCSALETLDLSGMKAPSVTSMSYMFDGCSSLTTLSLSDMDTRSLTNMNSMFRNCSALETLNMSGMNTKQVTNMSGMFNGCSGLTTFDMSGLDTSSVTNMSYMFQNCSALTDINLSGLDTLSVTNMSYMFQNCSALTDINLSGWNTSSVTSMGSMFSGCSSLGTLELSGLNTSAVTNMSSMFFGCSGLTTLDLSGFITSKVGDISNMFNGCGNLEEINFKDCDLSNVDSLYETFSGCASLKTLDLLNLNPEGGEMYRAFYGCSSLKELDLSGVSGEYMWLYEVFTGCTSLEKLDISGLDLTSAEEGWGEVSLGLETCTSLKEVKAPKTVVSAYGAAETGLPGTFWDGAKKADVTDLADATPLQTIYRHDAHAVEGIRITNQPDNTHYTAYQSFNSAGMTVHTYCSICGQDVDGVEHYSVAYENNADALLVSHSKVTISALIDGERYYAEQQIEVDPATASLIWEYTQNGSQWLPISATSSFVFDGAGKKPMVRARFAAASGDTNSEIESGYYYIMGTDSRFVITKGEQTVNALRDAGTYSFTVDDTGFDNYEISNNFAEFEIKVLELNLSDENNFYWILDGYNSALRSGYLDENNIYYSESGDGRSYYKRSIVRNRGKEVTILIHGERSTANLGADNGVYVISYNGGNFATAVGKYSAKATLTLKDAINYKFVNGDKLSEDRHMTAIVNGDGSVSVVKEWYIAEINNGLLSQSTGSYGKEWKLDDWTFGGYSTQHAPRLEHGDEGEADGTYVFAEDDDKVTFRLYRRIYNGATYEKELIGSAFNRYDFAEYINGSVPAGSYILEATVQSVSTGGSHVHWWNGESHGEEAKDIMFGGFTREFTFTVAKATLTFTNEADIKDKTFNYVYDGSLHLYGDTFVPTTNVSYAAPDDRSGVWKNAAYNSCFGEAQIMFSLDRWNTTGFVNKAGLDDIKGAKQTPKDADTYTVRYKIVCNNYEDFGGENSFSVVIAKKQVAIPVNQSVTYTGGEHVYTVAADALYSVSGTNAFINANANGYDVTLTLKDGDNYCWEGKADNEAQATVKLIINKADFVLSGITFEGDRVTYDGNAHSLEISGNLPDGVTVTYQNNGKTNAGTYNVTATFTMSTEMLANYNFTATPMTADLIINKASVEIPADQSVAFTGNEVGYNVENSAKYEVVGDNKFTEVNGQGYEITLRLKDSENYRWEGKADNVTEVTSKLIIKALKANKVIITMSESFAYGDTIQPVVKADFGSPVLLFRDGNGNSLGINHPVLPGSYTVTANVERNFTEEYESASSEFSFTIVKRKVKLVINPVSSELHADLALPTATVTEGSILPGDLPYVLVCSADKDTVGEYAITLEYASGFEDKYELVCEEGTYVVKAVSTKKTGIPWWVWLIVALCAMGICVAIFIIVKKENDRKNENSAKHIK